MEFTDFTAGINDDNRRLDKIIRNFVPVNLSEVYKFIRKGLIKLNHKKTKPECKVFQGDVISVASFILQAENQSTRNNAKENEGSEEFSIPMPAPMPPVVFQNEHILIIDKPYDIPVQQSSGSSISLDKIIQSYYRKNFPQNSLSFKTGPLHRLDRKTTGLLCFSLSLKGAQWFTENIKNHSIKKEYLTLLCGKLPSKCEWKDYIQKNQAESASKEFHTVKVDSAENGAKESREALTEITPLQYGKYKNQDVTFARVNIKTGRTHQIRAQSAIHGFPLLGDTAYGAIKTNEKREFFLQAYKLIFPLDNPISLPPSVSLPPSSDFLSILKSCGIDGLEI